MPPQSDNRRHSEAVDEVIGAVPSFLLRWGNTVLASVVLTALAVGCLVKTPVTLTGRVSITTRSPPSKLVAQAPGQLERLFVRDGAQVRRGDWLACIQSGLSIDSLRNLSSTLTQIEAQLAEGAGPPSLMKSDQLNNLGPLQLEVSELSLRLAEWRLYVEGAMSDQGLLLQEAQLSRIDAMRRQAEGRALSLQEELRLAENQANSASRLAEAGFLAPSEADEAGRALLDLRGQAQLRQIELDELRVSHLATEQSRLSLRWLQLEQGQRLRSTVVAAVRSLHEALLEWQRSFLLVAPMDGTVQFSQLCAEGQYVSVGEPVMWVIPPNAELVGLITVPEDKAGRLSVGNEVLIELDAWPALEHGIVHSKVGSVSQLTQGGALQLVVDFPDGLTTSHHTEIVLRHGMGGEAQVVTEDRRLITRIFYSLLEPIL